jgi:hypothetical protein
MCILLKKVTKTAVMLEKFIAGGTLSLNSTSFREFFARKFAVCSFLMMMITDHFYTDKFMTDFRYARKLCDVLIT